MAGMKTPTRRGKKILTATVGGVDLFHIEILDERPDGFSVSVPELAIFTFGATEAEAIDRVLSHVIDKYHDLLTSPIPLNANEQGFLKVYRTKIIPALFEASLMSPPPGSVWARLNALLSGDGGWQSDFLGGLKTSLQPSAG